jgi:hypothetical protein
LASSADQLHILWAQSNLFEKLSVGRLLNCLSLLDAALRKLPTIMARTPRPQHLPEVVEQYNADIGPIAVGIRNIMCVIWHEIMIRIRYVVSDTDSFMFFVIQAMLNN